MAALLTLEKDNTDKVVKYVDEVKRLKLDLFPPDINKSDLVFSATKLEGEEVVMFGMGAIKGAGDVAIKSIIHARNEDVDFPDLFYGTEIRRRHTENFLVGYDRLIELAKGCDTDNIILDTLIYSAHGLLNIRMRELHPDITFKPVVATNSVEYLERMISTDSNGS